MEASISKVAPRVRETAAHARSTKASASSSFVSHGRETQNATPTSPGQSIARCQMLSNPRFLDSASMPAKASRSMDRMIFLECGFHVWKPAASRVVQRPSKEPDERGSTSRRPSSDPTASAVELTISSGADGLSGNQTTWSSGRGISGSIQLNAWMRPFFRHSSTRSARASSDGTRRNCSRISSDRSAAEASVCASTNTS